MSIEFVPFDDNSLQIYNSWFVDVELRRRVEPPTDQWFNYVRHTPSVYAWLIYEDDQPIGHMQQDTTDDQTAHILLVVRPDLRGRGYGKRILRAFLARPATALLNKVEAGVEVDNIASQRCLTNVGFVQQDAVPDAEGFLHFVYHL